MAQDAYQRLSRRERQIMDVIYRRGEATASEVEAGLPHPPTNAAVRAKLRVLEEKGYLTHVQDGPRFLYRPTLRREQARRSALAHLVQTFFAGSVRDAMAALLELSDEESSEASLRRVENVVARHRANRKGRR